MSLEAVPNTAEATRQALGERLRSSVLALWLFWEMAWHLEEWPS